jgi:hypothetical protein
MDRFTTSIAAGVVLLIASGLGVAAFVGNRQPPPDLTQPSGVVLAYALAEQRGEPAAAWDLLAASAQSRTTRDQFIARASTSQGERAYLTTEDVAVTSDVATVTLLRTYPSSGGLFGPSSYSSRSTVRLTREPAGWRITVPHDDYLLGLPKSSEPHR